MKIKERISWQYSKVCFPIYDECLPKLLTEREKHLVKILEMIQIEKYVPVTARPDH